MYEHCNILARLRDVYTSKSTPTPTYHFTRGDSFYVDLRLPATTKPAQVFIQIARYFLPILTKSGFIMQIFVIPQHQI